MLLAPVFGPVLGGAIVDQSSWRWIFFINVPVGVAAVTAALRLLPEAKPQLGQRLDLRGLTLLSPGIALFLFAVSKAGNQGGISNARTLATGVAGLALVALFVLHARFRGRTALIDVSLFARRSFATSATANFLLPMALFGTLILLPLYYQVVRHQDPLHVGLLLMPQGVGAAIVMPFAGALTDRIGARVVVSIGVAVSTLGALAFTRVAADTSYVYLASALFVLGLGAGSTIMPSMAAAFQTLARDETPRATSALNTIQRIAGAIGTAVLAIVLQRTIAASHGAQPVAHAFGTTFWVAVGLIAATIVPALLLPRPERAEERRAPAAATFR
jgi:EmrB/QacA subfamily drug resistance transporter